MMPRTIELLVLVTAMCLFITTDGQQKDPNKKRTSPPRFKQMPPKEVSYKLSDISTVTKTLPCVADAEPPATYEWTKDGEPLTITGVDIKKLPGVGTLKIEHPTEDHEGIYQCRATNEYGTAVAVKTNFRAARLEPFATKLQPTVHKPEVGMSLTLRCNPPNSYPEPSVYWGESKVGSKLRPIDTDDRVALDFDGNLYFANVKMSDARNGKRYVCIASNHIIRGLVQGDDQVIRPFRLPDSGDEVTTKFQAVKLMWSSPSPDRAIAGTEKILKCIFSGFPTPIVEWKRLDKELSDKVYYMNNKLSLVIPNVDYDDEGTYECSAHNVGPSTKKTIKLEVQSVPAFVQAPENEVKAEEEDVEFTCRPGGKPRPKIEWAINGVPLSNAPPDSRRSVSPDDEILTIRNLSKTDSQVIQCNISNRHGYQFENAYLNVLAEPPTWLTAPDAETKAAEGTKAWIHCQTFGAPKPVITWTKDGEPLSDQFVVMKNGTLFIKDVYIRDQGTYKCHAVNKFGDIEQAGELIVREATKISKAPSDQTVNASSSVTFECEAYTDDEEADHLEIKWLKDGEEIDYESEPTIAMNRRDHSITISPARVADSGEFICVAGNGLDQDSATANLIVKDKPDPPTDVTLLDCTSTFAEVKWSPGNENNDEVIAFYVYYRTSFDAQGQYHEGAEVLRGTNDAKIGLSPWANYTFHVRAKNSLGMSDRSSFTSECKTQASRPIKNPDGVCTDSRDPSKLIITWKPMDKIDHNGPDFRYIVGYKRTDGSESDFTTVEITEYKQSEYVLEGTETFEEFEIYVQAANKEGTSPLNRLKKRYGYSGEGVPRATPSNFEIDSSTLNDTSAVFTWTGVPDDPELMQGHLIGYDIVFWKADDPENKRIHTVSAGPFEPCPVVRGRNKRQAGDMMEGHVLNLWPFSDIQAGVLVKNSKHSGALSDPPISFRTLEGVPDKVMLFEVQERGSHHFIVGWEPPTEPNGILLGYNVGHRPADDPNAEIVRQYVDDPLKRSTKIKDMEPDTEYILYIWARTNAGTGKMDFLEDKTKMVGPIDVPILTDFVHGENSLNASWAPSKKGNPDNPGSDFYVKYKKPGEDDWTRVDPEDPDDNSVNITDLTWGDQYEIVVVAVDGDGKERESEPKVITLGQNPEPVTQSVASAGWFIGMMCAIIFLLLVLIIVCLIKRNRGGKYPVHEKEKLRGRDPDLEDQEGGFGEYTRTPYMELKSDEPDYKKSAGSINDETKPLGESDSDSMAEYDETDPSKFNEDGSFIGQYGGKKSGDKMEPDATSPSALSTFV